MVSHRLSQFCIDELIAGTVGIGVFHQISVIPVGFPFGQQELAAVSLVFQCLGKHEVRSLHYVGGGNRRLPLIFQPL